MLHSRSRTWLWGFLIAGVVLIPGGAWAIRAVQTSAADRDVALVRALAVDTLILEHRIGLPDIGPQNVPPAADAARLREEAAAIAKAHYKGPLLATRSEQFLAAVNDRINGTSSVIDGGTNDISIQDTTVNDTSATVHLRATTWAKVSQNGVTANPISTDRWTFDLERVDGQWYVVNVDTDFHG
jgi:hypothetical protein